jgi:hypothetical protein
MATIEHLNGRHGVRHRPRDGKTVLACYPCNSEKGTAAQKHLMTRVEDLIR